MRRRRPHAVLVYSRVGGGHLSAARALAAELETGERFSTRLVDAYVDCGRFPLPLFPTAYARLARHHPRLWSLVYHGSDTRFALPQLLSPFLGDGFATLIRAERPDVVISVLPGINGLLNEAARRNGARTEVVLTDWHAVHRSWVARGVHHYTTPTAEARLDCLRFGARPDAVDVVGIPIRRAFSEPGDAQVRQRRLSELDLDGQRFTILALVGTEGSPNAFANLEHLVRQNLEAQMIVVCGRNGELKRQIEGLATQIPLRAVGFVDDIAELMHSADLLLTKAGGLTLAEAFCSHVPVVVHDVLPGQEEGNLSYVCARGAVEFAPTSTELGPIVRQLVLEPERRAVLVARGAQLARPLAAAEIASNVLRRLEAGD